MENETMVALSAILMAFTSIVKPIIPTVDPRMLLFFVSLLGVSAYSFSQGLSIDAFIDAFYIMLGSIGVYEVSKNNNT